MKIIEKIKNLFVKKVPNEIMVDGKTYKKVYDGTIGASACGLCAFYDGVCCARPKEARIPGEGYMGDCAENLYHWEVK